MKKKLTKKQKPEGKEPQSENDQKDEKSFDFGGIPNRDLKKNLGCG